MHRHHNTIYRQLVRIIGTPIFFHNGECAIYWHHGLLEPSTAALLARKLQKKYPQILQDVLSLYLSSHIDRLYRLRTAAVNVSILHAKLMLEAFQQYNKFMKDLDVF